MPNPTQLTSRGEREYRAQLVRSVSRTFALSIEVLPGVLSDAVSVAYLCFRVADGIEDHVTMRPDQKAALLRLWASILQDEASVEQLSIQAAGLDSRDPEMMVVRHAPMILNWLNTLPESFRRVVRSQTSASSLGMARWQGHGSFVEDEVALDDYMHEVAGRVGYLVTDLYALHIPAVMARREQMMPLSHECGLALQTVNVLRGLRADYERGWVFVPQTYFRSCGLTRETLFDPHYGDRAMQVVTLLTQKARRHLDNGYEYICSVPRSEHSARLSLMWPFLFAVRTLAICHNNPLTLTGEAKMSRAEVERIVLRSRLLGWSNSWLHQIYQTLLEGPDVRPSAVPIKRIPTPEGDLNALTGVD